jgi:hypothetical protein
MKNTKTIIGIVLIFLLGAASGVITTHMIDRTRFETVTKGGQAREDFIVGRLTRKLGLDSRQQKQIRTIIHGNLSHIRMIKKQFMPQIHATLEQGQTQIAAVLKPEQQEAYRDIIEKFKRHNLSEKE